MQQTVLEQALRTRIKRRRCILWVITALSLTSSIILTALYAGSRTMAELDYGFGAYEIVSYNHDLGLLAGLSWLLPVMAGILLLGDYLLTRLHVVDKDGCVITLYRGLTHTYLYVDGEQRDGGILVGYHLEAPLPDGTRVHVALGKWSAYMTFSGGHLPVEL